jgi:ketosteroid isomerase-like protein
MKIFTALVLALPALAACAADGAQTPRPVQPAAELQPAAAPATEPAPAPAATPAPAPPSPELQAALEALVRTEQEFSRTSAEKGTRDAFLAFLAEDSVMFRPGPVPGRAYMEKGPASPILLTWRPIHAEIAASGDLGYTTGPFELRASRDAQETSHGHYVTVWKKQADGTWKAVIDGGINTPQAYAGPEGSRVVPAAAVAAPGAPAARESLLGADRAFAEWSRTRGSLISYMTNLSDDVRFLRNGAQPKIGKEATRAAFGKKPPALTWEPQGGDVSAAGDFGYTYGSYEIREAAGQPAQPATYLRLWRRQPNRPWKVTLEMVLPLPKKE